jgi:outer membrane protein assembly factor BamD
MTQARISAKWIGIRSRAIMLAAVVSIAAACSSPKVDRTADWPPERLYSEAKSEMDGGRWGEAVKLLESLESRYPFGRWAQQAQLDIAYAHYKDNDRAQALIAIDRFIRMHPTHERLDYAYYLKGLVNFNEQLGPFAAFGGQDPAERDPKALREAFDAFREVVARFPDSRYAADAQARMRYLVNSMAASELHIARYYFSRGAYLAAANRAQAIVVDYQQTPAVEEALYIMMRSYDRLGLKDLSADAERVLRLNFPNSDVLAQGGRSNERRWWQLWQ